MLGLCEVKLILLHLLFLHLGLLDLGLLRLRRGLQVRPWISVVCMIVYMWRPSATMHDSCLHDSIHVASK